MKPITRSLFAIGFLLLALGYAPTAQARVDWQAGQTLKTEKPPLDVAGTVDGKWTFVLTEGGKVHIYDADGKLNDTLKVDPAMDRIAVPGQGDKVYLSSQKNKTVQELLVEFIVAIDTAGSPFLGPAKAPIEVVVFSDFQ